MNAKELANVKELLENWLQELLRRADHTVGDLREASDSLPDPLDRAMFEADRNFTLRIRDRESTLIKKIRDSLEEIEAGEYGICKRCGEPISIGRLKARPVARHCIECKRAMEQFEKLTGT